MGSTVGCAYVIYCLGDMVTYHLHMILNSPEKTEK